MRGAHLVVRAKRRRHPSDSGPRPTHAIAANLLDRDFTANATNQKWAADCTYVWTAEGWLYVAAVMDLYSRHIAGWSMQASMTSQLVIDALMWRCSAGDVHAKFRITPIKVANIPANSSSYCW